MLKHLMTTLPLLVCVACGSSGTTTLPGSEPRAVPPTAYVAPKISGTCRALSADRAIEYQNASTPVGTIGRWRIEGMNGGPFCTEPYLDQNVECEMSAGDVVVLRSGDELVAVQNIYAGETSIRIAQNTLTCSPLVVE